MTHVYSLLVLLMAFVHYILCSAGLGFALLSNQKFSLHFFSSSFFLHVTAGLTVLSGCIFLIVPFNPFRWVGLPVLVFQTVINTQFRCSFVSYALFHFLLSHFVLLSRILPACSFLSSESETWLSRCNVAHHILLHSMCILYIPFPCINWRSVLMLLLLVPINSWSLVCDGSIAAHLANTVRQWMYCTWQFRTYEGTPTVRATQIRCWSSQHTSPGISLRIRR